MRQSLQVMVAVVLTRGRWRMSPLEQGHAPGGYYAHDLWQPVR